MSLEKELENGLIEAFRHYQETLITLNRQVKSAIDTQNVPLTEEITESNQYTTANFTDMIRALVGHEFKKHEMQHRIGVFPCFSIPELQWIAQHWRNENKTKSYPATTNRLLMDCFFQAVKLNERNLGNCISDSVQHEDCHHFVLPFHESLNNTPHFWVVIYHKRNDEWICEYYDSLQVSKRYENYASDIHASFNHHMVNQKLSQNPVKKIEGPYQSDSINCALMSAVKSIEILLQEIKPEVLNLSSPTPICRFENQSIPTLRNLNSENHRQYLINLRKEVGQFMLGYGYEVRLSPRIIQSSPKKQRRRKKTNYDEILSNVSLLGFCLDGLFFMLGVISLSLSAQISVGILVTYWLSSKTINGLSYFLKGFNKGYRKELTPKTQKMDDSIDFEDLDLPKGYYPSQTKSPNDGLDNHITQPFETIQPEDTEANNLSPNA